MPVKKTALTPGSRGKTREGASFPAPPPPAGLPGDYAEALAEIKQRIQQERLRVVLAANSAMVLLYWDLGRMILDRQERAGWGAKVIDRLSADLRQAFADMKGFSPRNLKYMRAFAAAWPERAIVQQLAAQIPWFHNCLLLDRVADPAARQWYIHHVVEGGCICEEAAPTTGACTQRAPWDHRRPRRPTLPARRPASPLYSY
jgi:predicted nuclease of restriction endonuclease-like (RecB) superfamily